MRLRLLDRVHGRVARPARAPWNVVKTLVQSLSMWVIFYAVLPAGIYSVEGRLGLEKYRFASRRWKAGGVALFLLGWALAWTSAAFMSIKGRGTPLPADCPRELVIAGPYRHIRNPMAMSSFAQGIAVGLYVGSPLILLYVLAGMIGWNYLVRPWEELDLERRFGQPYAHYRDSVRCWMPQLRAYEPPGEQRVRRKT